MKDYDFVSSMSSNGLDTSVYERGKNVLLEVGDVQLEYASGFTFDYLTFLEGRQEYVQRLLRSVIGERRSNLRDFSGSVESIGFSLCKDDDFRGLYLASQGLKLAVDYWVKGRTLRNG